MQRARERDVKFTEVEQTLSGMVRLEKLVLGIGYGVSLRWYNIVVTNYTYVSKWRSACWECGLM